MTTMQGFIGPLATDITRMKWRLGVHCLSEGFVGCILTMVAMLVSLLLLQYVN